MKNKKGFTLVELVIVIAVIAILAGVMIGTFASVVKKANESAKMQEMAAQKTDQTANDVMEKLNNGSWLGWEDFETKLAEALADTMSKIDAGEVDKDTVKDATTSAVEAAFAKYAASLGTTNTGLTEEQVKYIVETALSKTSYTGVTEAQVKAIVNNAVSGTSTLTKSQVQAIVDAAAAKHLTLAQVTKAITDATQDLAKEEKVEDKFSEIEKNLTASIKNLKDAALTTSDIETLLAKFVSNGTAVGNYDWYNAGATTMAISEDTKTAADQVVALSTMVKGGTSFAGKTIELPATTGEAAIDLTEKESFAPLVDFDGEIKGAGNDKTIIKVNVQPVFDTTEGRNGKTASSFYKKSNKWQKEVVCYGFIASLSDGGIVENLTIDLAVNATDPNAKYLYYGGIVGLLDGGTIRNCKVTGSIEAYGTIGGVVGYAKCGVIDNVDVSGLKITSHQSSVLGGDTANEINTNKCSIGGIVGWASAGTLEVKNCTLAISADGYTTPKSGTNKGLLFGVVSPWKCGESKLTGWATLMEGNGDWMFKGAGSDAIIRVTNCTSGDSKIASTSSYAGWEDDHKYIVVYTIDGTAVAGGYVATLEEAIKNAEKVSS